MERLLQFSLERTRVIRLMYMEPEGTLRQVNATVISYDQHKVEVVTTRSPRPLVIPREAILSADFRRGDDGQ